jgi:DNA end-binding protein Ku
VKEDEIDPRFFETPYYLVPSKGGEKPYALLREAIRQTGSVGIGKIIIRQTQHLAGVKVVGDALVLEIMRFANELVDAKEFNFPARDAIRPQELQMAEQLVSNLAEPFDPTRYTDEYRANLIRVIKAKMKGKKAKLEEPEREVDSGVLDLMSRLRASLEEGTGKRGAVRAKRKEVAAGRKSAKSRKGQTA